EIAGLHRFADDVRPLPTGARISAIDIDTDAVRHSRLQRVDSLQLPAACDELHRSGRGGEEMPAAAEGQLHDVAGDEVVRHVESARPVVEVVEIVDRRAAFFRPGAVQTLRPRIRGEEGVAAREAALQLCLEAMVRAAAAPDLVIENAPILICAARL